MNSCINSNISSSNNDFLFKINRRNSSNCDFCDKFPESIIHIFCECDFVRPIWEELFKIIKDKYDIDFSASNFDKIFGVFGDKLLTYLFLCLKYHIYSCKFLNKRPTFSGFEIFVKNNREYEYIIAKKAGQTFFSFKKMEIWAAGQMYIISFVIYIISVVSLFFF